MQTVLSPPARKLNIARRRSANPIRVRIFCALFGLLIVSLFIQFWIDVAGFTLRAEDVISLALIMLIIVPGLLTGRIRYRRNLLNLPILLWGSVLLLGVIVTLASQFDGETKKNAVVNGLRLLLALGLFFAVFNFPAPAERKLEIVVSTIIAVSFATTVVSLLQIGHSDGWLPFALPKFLTTFKEGANTDKGREVFGLFIGDTQAHTWSGALAMQALVMWTIGRNTRRSLLRFFFLLYFVLLVYILVRISVRNNILALFFTIIGLEFVRRKTSRDELLRLVQPLLFLIIVVGLIVGLFTLGADSYFVERIRVTIPYLQDGEVSINRASNIFGRLEYWAVALEVFADYPILGGGFYGYQALSENYGPKTIVHAHNSYLQTLADFGIVGVAVLGLLVASILYYLLHTRRLFNPHEYDGIWWQVATGSFIFLAVGAIFSNPVFSPNYIAFRMLALGVLASLVKEKTR